MNPRMRLFFVLAAAAGAVLVVAVLYGMNRFAVHASAAPPAVLDRLKPADDRAPAPDVAFTDGAGKTLKLNAFRGRVVVVNLWATWCGPCITELPALARLNASLPQERVTVVPIDLEKLDVGKVGDFLKMHGAEGLPVYIDRNFSVLTGFVANALPLTVLIDAQGRVFARADGPQKWDDPAAVAYLKRVAAAK